MTTTTPGRRLHAALLAHGIEHEPWESYHPLMHRDFERAARQYDEERAAEDDYAFAEVGSRLAKIERDLADLEPTLAELQGRVSRAEADAAVLPDVAGRLARCEGRDGEIIERLGKLEADSFRCDLALSDDVASMHDRLARLETQLAALDDAVGNLNHAKQSIVAQQTSADQRNNAAIATIGSRLDALETAARKEAAYGERTEGEHWRRWEEVQTRLAALEARTIDGGDPLRRTG